MNFIFVDMVALQTVTHTFKHHENVTAFVEIPLCQNKAFHFGDNRLNSPRSV